MTDIDTSKPTEGWGMLGPTSKKAHYFRGTRSLCHRWGFYQGPLEADAFTSTDDCAACRKVLTKEQKMI